MRPPITSNVSPGFACMTNGFPVSITRDRAPITFVEYHGLQEVVEMRGVARADDRDRDTGLVEHVPDRDARDAGAMALRDRIEHGQQLLESPPAAEVLDDQPIGASGARVMARHVAPQCLAPFLIITTGHLGAAIFIEAALSFVGVGVPPPTPSWGNMLGGVLAEAFKPPWWMVVFPGTAITVTILAVNLFGDALRDFLDPKLK